MTLNRFRLPQIVALGAFILFVLTLSRGTTLGSLALTAKVAGWDWLPMSSRPLVWVLTLPLHVLPDSWIPVAINLVSAATAALVLGLLARCVELIPWDCPPDPKQPWIAKFPVLLAVAVCGLEFTFWQEATAASGEMVDALIFMISVWCLLEHRVDKKMSWLDLAALTWGLGMAENWAMLLTLPFFVVSLIVLRGFFFFQRNFLIRMAVLGLAGFSLTALLPLVNWLNPHSPWGFGSAWITALQSLREVYYVLHTTFWSTHRLLTIAVTMYFLVPLVPCLLPVRNQAAPNLAELDRYQIWLFRVLRLALLLACLWLAFDPEVGPRHLIRNQAGLALSLLTFDLVNAVGIAFLAGNLLFASHIPLQRRPRTIPQHALSWLRRLTPPAFVIGSVAVVALLLVRNLPAVNQFNRHSFSAFGRMMTRSLPADGGVVLGEDAARLDILHAALAAGGTEHRWQLVNVRYAVQPDYRKFLDRSSPQGWQAAAPKRALQPVEFVFFLDHLSRTNRLYFLEPQNGSILYEQFQPRPLGAVDELKQYTENRFLRLSLSPQEIADTEKFWDESWQNQISGLSQTAARPSRLDRFLSRHLHVGAVQSDQNAQLRHWYSLMLDDWGVQLQAAGQFAAAQKRFEQSLELSTNNVAAAANLACCTNLLAGGKLTLAPMTQVADEYRDARQLLRTIGSFGAIDEPGVRFVLGQQWIIDNLPRQAWQEFDRARATAPDAIEPRLAIAQMYSHYGFNAETMAAIDDLRPSVTNSVEGSALEVNLAILEAATWMRRTNITQANLVLQNLLQGHTDDPNYKDVVFKAFLAFGEATNALLMLDAELAKQPDNIAIMNAKATILVEVQKAADAIPVLDRALSLTNLPSIRLTRAIAYLTLSNYPAAEKDYTQLADTTADQYGVHYGLAQIALNRRDTNAASHQLQLCLSNSVPDSLRWRAANSRLTALAH